MSVKARFRSFWVLVPLAAVALVAAAAFAVPRVEFAPAATDSPIPKGVWGKVIRADNQLAVALGPRLDPSYHYELGLLKPIGIPTGLLYTEDGKNYIPLTNSKPVGDCGAFVWGFGVTALITIGKCVPSWATVSHDPARHHAGMWIRIENLVNRPRAIILTYDPLP